MHISELNKIKSEADPLLGSCTKVVITKLNGKKEIIPCTYPDYKVVVDVKAYKLENLLREKIWFFLKAELTIKSTFEIIDTHSLKLVLDTNMK
ncbi:hypothetical protein CWD77_09400 [Rhodohalobacter barkolensis]|uniref:Uncharacterized protein n=1 Tax=Rhodohalobacter barkolensis TaxID=2053187 RepID=A0A2N0VHX1_9BACT|nr:hypothetical protein CWD77_09400 [Rhodohalobacter barkolensis]